MCIYFNRTCLKKCNAERFYTQDEDFDYSQISADKEIVKYFNESESTFFTKFEITVLMLYTCFAA